MPNALLPLIPRGDMFIGGVMSPEWQQFFHDILDFMNIDTVDSVPTVDTGKITLRIYSSGATRRLYINIPDDGWYYVGLT